MIPLLMLAMLAAPAPVSAPAPALAPTSPATDPALARLDACAALVDTDPVAAAREAEAWRDGGGGMAARQCLGLAYVAQGRYPPAAVAFTQAAKDAELNHDRRAASLWVAAGNASLAGADAAVARAAFTRALGLAQLDPVQTGEAFLDRARAAVAAGDPAGARGDIDTALTTVAGDPMAWLLSATLARRQGQGTRAAKDIAEADRLAPGDAAIAYESGTIAMLNGLPDAARASWTRAAAMKGTPAAEMAARALAANPPRK